MPRKSNSMFGTSKREYNNIIKLRKEQEETEHLQKIEDLKRSFINDINETLKYGNCGVSLRVSKKDLHHFYDIQAEFDKLGFKSYFVYCEGWDSHFFRWKS